MAKSRDGQSVPDISTPLKSIQIFSILEGSLVEAEALIVAIIAIADCRDSAEHCAYLADKAAILVGSARGFVNDGFHIEAQRNKNAGGQHE